MLRLNTDTRATNQRGLFYQATLYESLGGPILAMSLAGDDLQPGTPTRIGVAIDLPANANVNSITAKLVVVDVGPSSASQKVKVAVKQGTTNTPYDLGVDVEVPPNLQNVEIRLEGGDVLFTRAGMLTPGDYDIPDFATHVNTFLDRAPAHEGKVTLPFLVKSETAGRARLEIKSHDYSLLQTQAWKNDLDGTFRVDRNLDLTFSQEARVSLDVIPVPAGKTLARKALRLDVSGGFGPERLLGSAEQHDGNEFVLVDADRSAAQRFHLSRSALKDKVRVAGVAAYFEAPAPAELYVELQPDADGMPAAGTPLGKANIAFAPATGSDRPWTFARFDGEVELETEQPYWIVAKAAQGQLLLGVQRTAGNPAGAFIRERAATHRGGRIWKNVALRRYSAAARSVAAAECLFALAYVPDLDTQMAAIELGVPGAATVKTDPGGTPATVAVPLSGSEGAAVEILVRSYASGSLAVANVVQEYQLS